MRRVVLWLCLSTVALAAVAAQGFRLTAPELAANARMPLDSVYSSCGGGNLSPALHWSDPPKGTQSFAVTMYDPDAPGGFWHWIAFNIPVGARGLNKDAGKPRGGDAPGDSVQLRNDFGNAGYSGPCPPPGTPHHYVITVYALDAPTLGLAAHVDRNRALAAINKHTLAKATLTVIWGR